MKKLAVICWFLIFSGLAVIAGPSRIIDLVAVQTNGGVVLRWTAPQPSGVTTLTNLDVRFSTSPINLLNWSSKERVVWLTDPGTPGTSQSAIIADLVPGTLYYFAIKTQDSLGIWSTMSRPDSVTGGDSTYNVPFAWDPSPSEEVTGYRIYEGTASGVYDSSVEVGNVTSGTITGRLWGVSYYYVVIAHDDGSEVSDPSNEVEHHRP